MIEAQPSRTALRVALRRAAHQLVDAQPLVFTDPYAIRILGPEAAAELQRTPKSNKRPHSAGLRAWMVARARYAEDTLAQAAEQSRSLQYLVLGAGLDTFALRNPFPHVRVFEVDHPATQAWKHHQLRTANLSLPETACLVPVDFEQQSLPEQLAAAGFDKAASTVTAWLGVVPYLTGQAFYGTCRFLGSLSAGSSVVFDYSQPRDVLPPVEQLMLDSMASRVAQAGEPFQLFFTPETLARELHRNNLEVIEDLSGEDLNVRYFAHRHDELKLRGSGGRLCQATVSSS